MAASRGHSHTGDQKIDPSWVSPREPLELELEDGALDVWLADLEAPDGQGLEQLLCAQERERAARIHDARTRTLWMSARGLLRKLLGSYLALPPSELRLVTGVRGKPRIAESSVEFNLSHSGSLALYAFARSNPVGVDIEDLRREPISAAALRRALGAGYPREIDELAPPVRQRALGREWVLYEAREKCRGEGILKAGRARRSAAAAPELWVRELELGAGTVGALAALHPPVELRCRRWPR